MKSAVFKFTAVAYWMSLVLWIAALITVGIAAMNTFGTLPDLGVQLDSYAGYPAEHHGRLAAGIVMERNFFLADVIQMFSVPVVILALLAQIAFFGMTLKRPANVIRLFCLCLAALLFAWYAFNLAPGMNRELRAYWQAAQAGQVEQADRHRRAFDSDHPQAERILQLNLFLVTIGACASAVAFVQPTPTMRTTKIQVPKLLNQP